MGLDRAFSPPEPVRSADNQKKVDDAFAGHALYQFAACPFCVKVRRGFKRLGVKVEIRNADEGTFFREELVSGGGELQVPCLRITESNGNVRWLYESSDILAYTEDRVNRALN